MKYSKSIAWASLAALLITTAGLSHAAQPHDSTMIVGVCPQIANGGCPNPNPTLLPPRPTPGASAAPPVATPTPAPTPRTPTATDVSQLTALLGRPAATTSSIAIVGNYAEICWYNGAIGGALLATNTSGQWTKVDSTFGGYALVDIQSRAPAIPATIATQLVSQAALNQI